ncbi:hypothetical protein YW7DRAFT_02693 [Streptomyces sp. AmelKG-E11A]|nr:hypothetical protein YW7DRAFT_02693 [Streptomyces sp. AmelKG-E11A]
MPYGMPSGFAPAPPRVREAVELRDDVSAGWLAAVMDLRQLLWSVGNLTWPDSTELICGESAHPAGHVCVPVPEGTPLDDLVEQLANWYGEPLTEDSELPLSLPAVAQGGWRYAWPSGGRWVALGDAQATDPARLLLVVAHRPVPAPGGTSADEPWPDRLVTLTG